MHGPAGREWTLVGGHLGQGMGQVGVVLFFQEIGDAVDDAGRKDAVPLVQPALFAEEPGRSDAASGQRGQPPAQLGVGGDVALDVKAFG